MTPRNARSSRRFAFEFLEGRNAPSHFAAHALIAHAVVHKAEAHHHDVQTGGQNESSSNDARNDSSNDASKESSSDSSKESRS
jgi:hypothetical protein